MVALADALPEGREARDQVDVRCRRMIVDIRSAHSFHVSGLSLGSFILNVRVSLLVLGPCGRRVDLLGFFWISLCSFLGCTR